MASKADHPSPPHSRPPHSRPPHSRPPSARPPLPAASGSALGDLPRYAGYLLRRAQLAVFQDFIGSLASHDMRPPQFAVLCVLEAAPGLRQSEVAALLGMQRTNFVALFDGLEKRGLAERRPSPEDRRSHALHLTPAGTTFLAEVKAGVEAHEARLAAHLGAEDYRALTRILGRLASFGDAA